jgi:hypothetical protein
LEFIAANDEPFEKGRSGEKGFPIPRLRALRNDAGLVVKEP